ncbi:ABC transporter permease [Mangrovicella endophytica]|uniref:ABC transporter permease n=1 Tax=Mangrovicella endophytica TaxID=2066697 RepID=UPI001FE1F0D2|nr:ABC transporter permease [Mangrovicella endophytica]
MTTLSNAANATAPKAARRMRRRLPGIGESLVLSLAGFAILFGGWWLLARSGLVPEQVLPGPDAVLAEILHLMRTPFAGSTLQMHLLSSIGRYLMGLALAVAVGLPLGLLMGWSRRVERAISPVFEALRFIAPIAWLPFATLWFGTGIGGPILIIFSGAFPPCVINAYYGAKLIPTPILEASRTLGASSLRMLTDVLAPGALPSIIAGVRIAAGIGWQSLVGAELIVVSSGVGYLMMQGQTNLSTAVVMAGMAAIGVTGFAIDVLLRLIESRIQKGALA